VSDPPGDSAGVTGLLTAPGKKSSGRSGSRPAPPASGGQCHETTDFGATRRLAASRAGAALCGPGRTRDHAGYIFAASRPPADDAEAAELAGSQPGQLCRWRRGRSRPSVGLPGHGGGTPRCRELGDWGGYGDWGRSARRGPGARDPRLGPEPPGITQIAMAPHGRSGLGRWVCGSVAERVLQAASVLLLVTARGPAPCSGGAYQTILVPWDGSAGAAHALEQAALLAPAMNAQLLWLA
jgi:hypothetical protein